MRRAMRHAELLGANEPLMWRLVPVLVREMGQAYPELHARRGADHRDAQARGDALPPHAGARPCHPRRGDRSRSSSGDMFDGETAFTLYDTYGFPLDLTQDALRPRGISVDIAAFNDAMERQREKARASWAGSGEAATETVWFRLARKARRHRIPRLRDRERRRRRRRAGQGRRRGRRAEDGRERRSSSLNQTPFYGESGGQVGDTGVMTGEGVALPRHRHAEACRRRVRPRRHRSRKARCNAGAALALEVDHAPPRRDPPEPFGDASPARGAAPGARRSRRAEGLAGRAGPAALRLLASQADDGRGDRARRGHRQRHRAAERAGDDAR